MTLVDEYAAALANIREAHDEIMSGRHGEEMVSTYNHVIAGELRRIEARASEVKARAEARRAERRAARDNRPMHERVEESRRRYAAEQGPSICELCGEEIKPEEATRAGQVHWTCWEKTQ